MFEVIEKTTRVQINGVTRHIQDRLNRYNMLEGVKLISAFVVNTGHRNGLEIHAITEKAEILITNKTSGLLVTILFARPNQIKRYGINNQQVLKQAEFNLKTGKNFT